MSETSTEIATGVACLTIAPPRRSPSFARLPVVLVGAVILWMPLPATIATIRPEGVSALQASLIFPALISLACVVAGYSLLVVGIRRSTGARGYALALQSLAVFLLAEIAGKLLLVALR